MVKKVAHQVRTYSLVSTNVVLAKFAAELEDVFHSFNVATVRTDGKIENVESTISQVGHMTSVICRNKTVNVQDKIHAPTPISFTVERQKSFAY